MINITELNKDLAQYFIDELTNIIESYVDNKSSKQSTSVRLTKLLAKLIDHEEIIDKDTLLGLAQEVMTFNPDLLYVFDELSKIRDELRKSLDAYSNEVDNTHTHPWLSKDKGKPKKVYETITKFRKMIESGDEYDLESTEVALMLSSIITHVLLDIKRNGTSHDIVMTYGLPELSDAISSLIYNGLEFTDYQSIYQLLKEYKYFD